MTTLVLSDVHANAVALSRVLAAETDVDRVLFLGDAVDCGPQPNAALTALRSVSTCHVIGNHDRLLLNTDSDSRAESPAERWIQWSRSALSPTNLAYLEAAPQTTVVDIGGSSLRLHHGDFEPPDGFEGTWQTRTTPESSPVLFKTVAQRYDEEYILHGHSHLPFVAEVGGTTFVNPGSVGLQRSDWRQDLARYAIFDGGEFNLEAVQYDVSMVVDAYDDISLPGVVREFWKAEYRLHGDAD